MHTQMCMQPHVSMYIHMHIHINVILKVHSWSRWLMSATLPLKRLRREGCHELEASLGHRVRETSQKSTNKQVNRDIEITEWYMHVSATRQVLKVVLEERPLTQQ